MAISDLIEQTIAQHIIAPRVISYAPSKLNEVTGRFVSSNRVYNFVLNKSGVSYSPAGQGDSLLFSALYLRQDAVRKAKVGNDRCNAGKSYQCGKICLGNRRKCHKGVRDVNDARRIASILEGTNEKLKGSLEGSDKAKARGKALFEARKGRVEKPKAKPDDADALNRLEQLIELGKEVVKPTKTNETVAPSSVLSSYKNAKTPSVELSAKVVSELNEIVKTNKQANLPKGVKRHQGYLVADNDFYHAFARTGGEWTSDARSAIRGSTIKSVIDQIKTSDPKYFSDKPEDNIILGDKDKRYMVVRRLKSGELSSPTTKQKFKDPLLNSLTEDQALDLVFDINRNKKGKLSTYDLTSDQIRDLFNGYSDDKDIQNRKSRAHDYNPETAQVGDVLRYRIPTYEHKEKGLDYSHYQVSSVNNGKVYGFPIDKNGNKLLNKKIPIISSPSSTSWGKKGDRYARLVFDKPPYT